MVITYTYMFIHQTRWLVWFYTTWYRIKNSSSMIIRVIMLVNKLTFYFDYLTSFKLYRRICQILQQMYFFHQNKEKGSYKVGSEIYYFLSICLFWIFFQQKWILWEGIDVHLKNLIDIFKITNLYIKNNC